VPAAIEGADPACERCHGLGYVPFQDIEPPRYSRIWVCSCTIEQQMRRFLGGGRFAEAEFSNFNPKTPSQKHAMEQLQANPCGSYFLSGSYGTGKSHLVASQYKTLRRRWTLRPTAYLSDAEYAAAISLHFDAKRRGADDSPTPMPISAKAIREASWDRGFHVFFSDFGKAKPTAFFAQRIFELLDAIFQRTTDKGTQKFGITIASNVEHSDLAEYFDQASAGLGTAISRRLEAMCSFLRVEEFDRLPLRGSERAIAPERDGDLESGW
jgi:hypothetical protein